MNKRFVLVAIGAFLAIVLVLALIFNRPEIPRARSAGRNR